MEYEVFPGEGLVRKAGRRIFSDYEQLRNIILNINEKNVPFLNCLGLDTEPEKILQLCGKSELALERAFVDYVVKRKAKLFQEGKISVSAIIHPSGRLGFDEYPGGADRKNKKLPYVNIPPYSDNAPWGEDNIIYQKILEGARREYIGIDLKESVPLFLMRRKYGRWLIVRYKEILKDVEDRTGMFWQAASTESLRRAELFLEAITFSQEEGLIIDVRKFMAKYVELSEGKISEIYQRHQEAATAINKFFGGVEVTEKRINKFFVVEDGLVKTNPKSVSSSGYMELL